MAETLWPTARRGKSNLRFQHERVGGCEGNVFPQKLVGAGDAASRMKPVSDTVTPGQTPRLRAAFTNQQQRRVPAMASVWLLGEAGDEWDAAVGGNEDLTARVCLLFWSGAAGWAGRSRR